MATHPPRLRALALLALGLGVPATAQVFRCATPADMLLSQDFNHRAGDIRYTINQMRQDFPTGVAWDMTMQPPLVEDRLLLVTAPGFNGTDLANVALRVEYPRACWGSEQCGVQFKARFAPVEEAWVAYRIQFSENFEWVKGGKLPGLCGGKCNSGLKVPVGDDGWSARLMWRANGAVQQYVYFVDQRQSSGDEYFWTENANGNVIRFQPGYWYPIITHVKLNTPGMNDGLIESYLGKELVMTKTGLRLRTVSSLKIDTLFFSTFYGGNDSSWSPRQTTSTVFDDILVCSGSQPVLYNDQYTGPARIGSLGSQLVPSVILSNLFLLGILLLLLIY